MRKSTSEIALWYAEHVVANSVQVWTASYVLIQVLIYIMQVVSLLPWCYNDTAFYQLFKLFFVQFCFVLGTEVTSVVRRIFRFFVLPFYPRYSWWHLYCLQILISWNFCHYMSHTYCRCLRNPLPACWWINNGYVSLCCNAFGCRVLLSVVIQVNCIKYLSTLVHMFPLHVGLIDMCNSCNQ